MASLMVVEDEVVISMELEEKLTAMGHTVVGNMQTADESVELAGSSHPDLVLMDIVTPGTLDGIDAAEILRDKFDIPVIFVTAWQTDEFISRAVLADPYGYIVKPFEEGEIRATIDVALNQKRNERSTRHTEHHMRSMLDTLDDAILSVNTKGMLLYYNKAAANLILKGRECEKNVVNIARYILPEKREIIQQLLIDTQNTGTPQEYTGNGKPVLRAVDGTEYRANLTITPITVNGLDCITITIDTLSNEAEGPHYVTICSYCHKIRDNGNRWKAIEAYFDHIAFSHGICPDCLSDIYPDIAEEEKLT